MIDFSKCKQPKKWLLVDPEGNIQEINNIAEWTYARMIIAENRLEGYRVESEDGKIKREINHYGVPFPNIDGIFDEDEDYAIRCLRAAMKTKNEEDGDEDDE